MLQRGAKVKAREDNLCGLDKCGRVRGLAYGGLWRLCAARELFFLSSFLA